MRHDVLLTSRGIANKETIIRKLAVPLKGINNVSIVSVCIPNSFYSVSALNNTLIIGDSTPTDYTITITPGSYGISDLLTEMKNKLDASSHAGTFTCIYSPNTLKITISCTTQFSMTYVGSTIAPVIGLSANFALGTSHTMQNVFNISRTERIHIVSKALTVNRARSQTDGAENSNLISMVLDVGAGEIFRFVPDSYGLTRYPLYKDCVISSIDLSIVDDDGEYIDLNGLDWSVQLALYD